MPSPPPPEPIAILGAGCRFPGGADSLGAYWELLLGPRDAISTVPAERWDAERWTDPDPDAVGKTYTARGGFVAGVDTFDPAFFQISPREARSVAPQQRWILEVAWEALEHAGIVPTDLVGSDTGVFAGVGPNDYGDPIEGPVSARTDVYAATGRLVAFAAGRLSYTLGLRGPSVVVDTACSASLVAVHLACQSLRDRSCSLALAAGVSVMLAPTAFVDLSRLRALSPRGVCSTFDAEADGYVRGEGCGVVVLKRLDDAIRDGDRVLAVIRGGAVNHDGASSGLTVPSADAQVALLRQALQHAGLPPEAIDLVETHGTGTPLGDPIEVGALADVYGPGRRGDRPLRLASVKSRVGHLEAASGMASLLKVIASLHHEVIPGQLHFSTPHPRIPWGRAPLVVNTDPVPWPRTRDRPRRAGISAFGLSGTNAHLVVEEGPPPLPVATGEDGVPALTLSARTGAALRAQAARMAVWLRDHPEALLRDVAWTTAVHRAHLDHRLLASSPSRAALVELLERFAAGEHPPGVVHRQLGRVEPPAVVVVCADAASAEALARDLGVPAARRVGEATPGWEDVIRELRRDDSLIVVASGVTSDARRWLATLPGDDDESASLEVGDDPADRLAAWGALYTRGVAIDWRAVWSCGVRLDLPSYPFQRKRYWLDEPGVPGARREAVAPDLAWPVYVGWVPDQRAATELATWLESHPRASLSATCRATAAGAARSRSLAVVAPDRDTFVRRLRSAGQPVPRSALAVAGTAWLYTGQGAQFAGMARPLYDEHPVCRALLDRCEAVTRDARGASLLEVMFASDGSRLERTAWTQPATFAFEAALTGLWRAWGASPAAVVGHSVGELAACWAAGVFELEDALAFVLRRASLMDALPEGGAMAAVFAAEVDVRRAIDGTPVAVASVNGPTEVVISGDEDLVTAVVGRLADQGIRARRLRVSHAFHSPRMASIGGALDDAARALTSSGRPPLVPVVSTTTGAWATAQELLDPIRWRRQALETVRFEGAVRTLAETGVATFLEVGPAPVLVGMVGRILPDGPRCLASSSRSDAPAWPQLLRAAVDLQQAGVELAWERIPIAGAGPELGLPEAVHRDGPEDETPAANPVALDVRAVADLVARVLGLDEPPPRRITFGDLGMDSLRAMELAALLSGRLGRPVPPTVAFDHPTVEALSAWILGQPAAHPARSRIDHRGEPIAVVGLGCRFPGGASDPEAYWRLLREGRDGVVDVPPARWTVGDDASPAERRAGFLSEPIDGFDAKFFGISPREAVGMDPQQRLLLEVAWEALEAAGIPATGLRCSPTGVYLGIATADYAQLRLLAGEEADAWAATGTASSVAAGRLAYALGLQGPALAIDTACSSSLVALHLACRDLRAGDCDLALAAGVNLMLAPLTTRAMARMGALAADGRCKTFDAAADGYGRGEGCGVVVLKRLSDAEADGDHVLAVICGTAVNQDGPSSGLTAPNGPAQTALVARALADGGLAPRDLDYVECHGTGTPLGDPVELGALGAVVGDRADRPLWVASAKANLGHLEAAAGVAGLIKLVLALGHAEVPPAAHFSVPNPLVPWSRLPLHVPTSLAPWPARPGSAVRVGGVSAFGFSGTNAHAVVRSAPARVASPLPGGVYILPISARSPTALRELGSRWLDRLDATPEAEWGDLCATACLRSSHHPFRLAVVAEGPATARAALATALDGPPEVALEAPTVVFVFAGQGSQWRGMGRALARVSGAYAETWRDVDQAMGPVAGRTLDAWLDDPAALERIDVVQPLLFGVQVALAAAWRARGVRPDVVIGHSMGEAAAALVAGLLDLPSACAVIRERSRLLGRLGGSGAMALVGLSEEQAHDLVRETPLTVAAVNGPRSTVVAGPAVAVDAMLADLEAKNVFGRRVEVDVASHTAAVEPVLPELADALAGCVGRPGLIPFRSTVTAERATGPLGAEYWLDNLRRPVRFADAVRAEAASGPTVFVEVGPHPLLLPSIEASGAGRPIRAVATTRRGADDEAAWLGAVAAAWQTGATIELASRAPGVVRPGPAYPWDRRRYWPAVRTAAREAGPSSGISAEATAPPASGASRDELASLPIERRLDRVVGWVLEEVCAVLGLEGDRTASPGEGFFQLGMDSVMSVELKTRLERRLGVSLPATVTFEHPNATAMATFLLAEVLELAPAALAPLVVRVRGAEEGLREPIAIVGLGCRLPGGVADPDALWRLLVDGVDAIGPVPSDRWDNDRVYDPRPGTPGRTYVREGGFLSDVAGFDPLFFDLSPREAAALDPQHRIFLEVCWEALEDAAIDATTLRGTAGGVYAGIISNEYLHLQLAEGGDGPGGAFRLTGGAQDFCAGRVSYLLGLHGPSLAIASTCSSSLVAIHLACQALRLRECDLALAGGVNLMLAPEANVLLCSAQMLSADGRCKAFDASANGYGRGEGSGVLVLKRLSDALAAGDRVQALVLGSAVNQDGAGSGMTVPNAAAQQAVIRAALAAAGRTAAQVGYLEAHGTGTALGDPIELRAAQAVLGGDREGPLWIGSIKSNVGHLEAAAGVAGVLKAALAVGRRVVPPHLHFRQPSAAVDWQRLRLRVPTRAMPWPSDGPAVAGVSSFAASGTNVHAVIGEPPPLTPRVEGPRRAVSVLPLSARSPESLDALADGWARILGEPGPDLADALHTAGVGRAHLPLRLAVTGRSASELRRRLARAADDPEAEGVWRGKVDPRRSGAVFLYTGQGSQQVGMGRALHLDEPSFRSAFDEAAAEIASAGGPDLHEALIGQRADAEALSHTSLAQPALFVVGVALTRMWASFGVEPIAVAGHSLGEVTAAWAAGVFSLRDAARVVVARARAMGDLPPGGAMVAVLAPLHELGELPPDVEVAATNGPREVVLSGPSARVAEVRAALEVRGLTVKPLDTSHAFHSRAMTPARSAFAAAVAEVERHPPRIDLWSGLTGERATPEGARDPERWARQLVEPVRFGEVLSGLAEVRAAAWVELGPRPVLLGMARRAGLELPPLVASLAGPDEPLAVADAVAGMYAAGVTLDWRRRDAGFPLRRVRVPTYPFRRDRHWFVRGRARSAPRSGGLHPLLGEPLRAPGPEHRYQATLSLDDLPDLRDNHGLVHVGLYLEALAVLAAEVGQGPGFCAREGHFHQGLTLTDGQPRTVHTELGAADALRISSVAEGAESRWEAHFDAVLGPAPAAATVDVSAMLAREAKEGAEFYRRLDEVGLKLGASMRLVERLHLGTGEVLASFARAEGGPLGVSGALVDACFQLFQAFETAEEPGAWLLAGWDRLSWHRRATGPVLCLARLEGVDGGRLRGSLVLLQSADGLVVGEAHGITMRHVPATFLARLAADQGAPAAAREAILAADPAERPAHIEAWLRDRLSRLLQVDADSPALAEPLNGLLDSLLTMEIASRAQAELGVVIPMEELLGDADLDLERLKALVSARLPASS